MKPYEPQSISFDAPFYNADFSYGISEHLIFIYQFWVICFTLIGSSYFTVAGFCYNEALQSKLDFYGC